MSVLLKFKGSKGKTSTQIFIGNSFRLVQKGDIVSFSKEGATLALRAHPDRWELVKDKEDEAPAAPEAKAEPPTPAAAEKPKPSRRRKNA